MKPVAKNESRHLGQNEMAGLKGKSGPPGNMNAFKHGLAAIQKRREEAVTTEHEESALNPFIAQCSPDLQSGVCFNEPQPVRNRKGKFPTCF
jgi:hypothetical protein